MTDCRCCSAKYLGRHCPICAASLACKCGAKIQCRCGRRFDIHTCPLTPQEAA